MVTGVSRWQGLADQGDPGTVLGMAEGARQPDDRDGRVALQRFAGFVRNVMVGRNGLSAEVLRELVVQAGGHEPRSHLATGNLTFSASPELQEVIRAGIEDSIENGRYLPSLPLALAIARNFDTTVEEIFIPDEES